MCHRFIPICVPCIRSKLINEQIARFAYQTTIMSRKLTAQAENPGWHLITCERVWHEIQLSPGLREGGSECVGWLLSQTANMFQVWLICLLCFGTSFANVKIGESRIYAIIQTVLPILVLFSHTRIISAFDKIPPKYGSIVEEIYGKLKPENAAGISEKSKKFAIFPWTCDRRREPFGPFFNDKVRLPADWQWCHGGRWRQSWTYGSANCVNFKLRRGAIFTNQPIFAMGKRVHEIQYLFEFVPFTKDFGRGKKNSKIVDNTAAKLSCQIVIFPTFLHID